jgi:hypothetical protein
MLLARVAVFSALSQVQADEYREAFNRPVRGLLGILVAVQASCDFIRRFALLIASRPFGSVANGLTRFW